MCEGCQEQKKEEIHVWPEDYHIEPGKYKRQPKKKNDWSNIPPRT